MEAVLSCTAPDVPYWPGRRRLTAADAVVWPSVVWGALSHVAGRGGLLLAFVMALLVVSAARHLFTALLANHRYHFTTWRWGRVLIWTLAVVAMLKLGTFSCLLAITTVHDC